MIWCEHKFALYRVRCISALDKSWVPSLITTLFWEKMGFCRFFLKYPAKCSMSETNLGNISVLKLDFLKIEFQMYNSIFGILSYSECGLRIFFWNSSSTWIFSRNSSSMNLSTSHGNWVPWMELEFREFEFHFFFSTCYNSNVQKSSFKLKLYF